MSFRACQQSPSDMFDRLCAMQARELDNAVPTLPSRQLEAFIRYCIDEAQGDQVRVVELYSGGKVS